MSVIVIAWNVRDELEACFQSIRDHRGNLDVEVFFIDNGSVDGSADFVAERFPEVVVVRRPTNEGVPARNYGLRRATGRLRMFLDSDARLTAEALPAMVAAIDADPSVGLVGPKLVYSDGSLQLSTRRYPPLALPILRRPPLARYLEDGATVRHHLMVDEPHDRLRRVEYVLGACQIFRAAVQWEVGEIDQAIWYGPDDADWCFRIREAGYDIVYVPDAVVIHDYRRTSTKHPISMLAFRHLSAHLHFQRTWWRQRGRLIAEGRAMDRQAALDRNASC